MTVQCFPSATHKYNNVLAPSWDYANSLAMLRCFAARGNEKLNLM